MDIWLEKAFARWAARENVAPADLRLAAEELSRGLFDASLGRAVYKKRVARAGGGRRGGFRTLLAFRPDGAERVFFLHGFAKSDRANVSGRELEALKLVARSLLALSAAQLDDLERSGRLLRLDRLERTT